MHMLLQSTVYLFVLFYGNLPFPLKTTSNVSQGFLNQKQFIQLK